MLIRELIPKDTSREAWEVQLEALKRMGPERRVELALELSEFVRAVHLAGLRARHPEWSHEDAIRHIILVQYHVDLAAPR